MWTLSYCKFYGCKQIIFQSKFEEQEQHDKMLYLIGIFFNNKHDEYNELLNMKQGRN